MTARIGPGSKRSPVARSIVATILDRSAVQMSLYCCVAAANDSADAVKLISSGLTGSWATSVLDRIAAQNIIARMKTSHGWLLMVSERVGSLPAELLFTRWAARNHSALALPRNATTRRIETRFVADTSAPSSGVGLIRSGGQVDYVVSSVLRSSF